MVGGGSNLSLENSSTCDAIRNNTSSMRFSRALEVLELVDRVEELSSEVVNVEICTFSALISS
jgi:hypothetical protein